MRRNKAYTMVEMLVVLTVVTLILLIPTIAMRDFLKQQEEALFVARFDREITKLQKRMITCGKSYGKIQVKPNATPPFVRIHQTLKPQIDTDMPIPKGISFTDGAIMNTGISFNTNGHYSSVTYSFIMTTTKEKYFYQFYIGDGKFEKSLYKEPTK
jgi:prepilin-type N-terminal cleavage/methylation domain-containing protein